MFVKRTVKHRGETAYEYLALVEAVRVEGKNTHRTLSAWARCPSCASPAAGPHRQALATYAKGTYVEADEIEGLGSPSFGAVAAAWSYFRRLGLEEHFSSLGDGRRSRVLSDTVFAMVANRLTDPFSKRRTITEWLASVALPAGVTAPSLDQLLPGDRLPRRAQGSHRGASLLRAVQPREPGPAPGLLRPHIELLRDGRRRAQGLSLPRLRLQPRSPIRRPQIMIGLLVTSDGIPIAHHVFSGTRPSLDTAGGDGGLKSRFGVGRIALVADRGLISEDNLALVGAHGFDHVLPRVFTTTTTSQPCSSWRTRPHVVGSRPRGAELLCRSHP